MTQDRIVVITGASAGIGHAAAVRLGAQLHGEAAAPRGQDLPAGDRSLRHLLGRHSPPARGLGRHPARFDAEVRVWSWGLWLTTKRWRVTGAVIALAALAAVLARAPGHPQPAGAASRDQRSPARR